MKQKLPRVTWCVPVILELKTHGLGSCNFTYHQVSKKSSGNPAKNLPANAGDIREWIGSLGWADPLEEEIAVFHFISVFLPGEFLGQRSLVGYRGLKEWQWVMSTGLLSRTWLCDYHTQGVCGAFKIWPQIVLYSSLQEMEHNSSLFECGQDLATYFSQTE